MEKKTWTKPELIALVRSLPEEAVLTSCKTLGASGGNPDFFFIGCQLSNGCAECSTASPS